MSDQQMRHRLEGILTEDIPSLSQMSAALTRGRIEILADFARTTRGDGYMGGTYQGERRIDTVVAACQSVGAALVWVHETGSGISADWLIEP